MARADDLLAQAGAEVERAIALAQSGADDATAADAARAAARLALEGVLAARHASGDEDLPALLARADLHPPGDVVRAATGELTDRDALIAAAMTAVTWGAASMPTGA